MRLHWLLPSTLGALSWMLPASAHAQQRGPFELQPMVGYAWVDLTGLSERQFVDSYRSRPPSSLQDVPTTDEAIEAATLPVEGEGLSLGLSAQLRFAALLLGVRYAFTDASDVGLHTLAGDIGFHVGKEVSFYLRAGVGYAHQVGLPEGIETNGLLLTSMTGLDFVVTPAVSVGFGLDLELLSLSRQGQLGSAVTLATGGGDENTLRDLDGSAFGYLVRPQFHAVWRL